MEEYELISNEIDLMLSEIEDIHLDPSVLDIEDNFIPIDLPL